MKFPRMLVILGGIAGLVAFFMPLVQVPVQVEGKNVITEISGYQVVKGVSSMQEVVKGITIAKDEDDKASVAELNTTLEKSRTVYLAIFAPAVLLLLVGLMGRLGRGKATFALIFGLLLVGAWALLNAGLKEAAQEQKNVDMKLGIAVVMLLGAGVAGAAGGLFGLISPERKSLQPTA